MVDIASQLQKRLQESEKASESLSDRLNKLDQFNTQVANPQIASEGPKGFNPMNSLQAFMGTVQNRKGLEGELGQQRNQTTNILDAIMQMQQSQADRSLRQQQFEADKAYRDEQLKLKRAELGLKINPETGELEIAPMDVGQQVDQLSDSAKKTISDYTAALKEMESARQTLTGVPGGDVGDIGSMFSTITGPAAGRFGHLYPFNKGKQARSDLDILRDKIRKDIFGSAFTETEKKEATLMGSKVQEAENQRILNSYIKQKTNELKTTLRNQGFSEAQIQQYLESQGLSAASEETQSSSGFTIEEIE